MDVLFIEINEFNLMIILNKILSKQTVGKQTSLHSSLKVLHKFEMGNVQAETARATDFHFSIPPHLTSVGLLF